MMRRAAFSLVELSIVLVILGLLVGGILAGQSLIRASELRAVTTEHSRILTATQAFRDKYFALPGDMTNATSFWGIVIATAACRDTAGTGTATCNGDGNGLLQTSTYANEMFRYWQHLANAGLIEGTYNGISSDGSPTGVMCNVNNTPGSKINNSAWFANNWPSAGIASDLFAANYGNTLQFGIRTASLSNVTPALSAPELWNIDTKMDDGTPANGKVLARSIAACTNGSSVTDRAAQYSLSASGIACVALFPNAF